MTTKQKILQYLEVKGISKREFYLKTGLSNGFLDSGKYISTENAEIIISNYPDMSLEWLIMGTGEMLKTKSVEKLTVLSDEEKTKGIENLTIEKGKKNGKEIDKNKKYKKPYHITNITAEPEVQTFGLRTDHLRESQHIPLYDIEAVAGLIPLFNDTVKQIPVGEIQIPNLPRCDGAIYITGDSMYPLLKSGDIVLYKQVNDFENCIFWGEMYLISIDMEGEEYVTVKYIQKSDTPAHIRLVSYNQHHSDKDIPIESIRALAFIKASIRINSMR